MAEETRRQSHFPRIGALGFQLAHRIMGFGSPLLVRVVPLVSLLREEPRNGKTHRSERTAYFQIGDPFRHRKRLGKHDRSAYRRIEERRLGGIGSCKLRRPVSAAGEGKEIGILETGLDRREQRLRLVTVPRLDTLGLRIVQLHYVEDIGDSCGHDRPFVAENTLLHVRIGGPDIGIQRPVLPERLVDVHQNIGIGLLVDRTLQHEGTFRQCVGTLVRQRGVRRRIEFLGVFVVGVVDPHASRHRQPVENPVIQIRIQHVAVFLILAQVAIGDPVGILSGQRREHLFGPVLRGELPVGVPAFVHPNILPVVPAREKVSRHQRIRIGSLVHHVHVALLDVAGSHVERHTVFQERRSVTEREIVTVVVVIGNHPLRIDRRSRDIGLVFLRACRESYGLGRHDARLQEIVGRVIPSDRSGVQTGSPALVYRRGGRSEAARAVTVLEFGHTERTQKFRVLRYGDAQRSGLALLRGDDDGSVGGIVAVKGRCGGSRQHRNRFDVFGIDVRDSFRRAPRVELRTAFAAQIEHRDTVDYIKSIRRLADGLAAAHHHFRSAAHTRRRGVYVHAGNLTVQRVDEIGVFVADDIFGIHLLHVVRQRLLRTFDTQSRYHDGIDGLGLFAQGEVDLRTLTDENLHRSITQEIDSQHGRRGRCRNLQGVRTIEPRARTDRRALHKNRRTDHRSTGTIRYPAADRKGFVSVGSGQRQQDILPLDTICEPRSPYQLIENLAERLLLGMNGNELRRGIDALA